MHNNTHTSTLLLLQFIVHLIIRLRQNIYSNQLV